MVFLFLTPVPKHPQRMCVVGIIRHHRSAFSARAKILAWVEAEATHVAYRANALSLVFSAVSLRRVFNQSQTVRTGNRLDFVHVRRVTVQMYRNHCPCLFGYRM